MIPHSPTPREVEWCTQKILQIKDRIPAHYSKEVQQRLKEKGIKLGRRYICNCKNLARYDHRVVKEFIELVQAK